MKNSFFLLTFCLLTLQAQAQVIYGLNNYTQYHPGSLPIVISVPHGGLVAPASIPNRTCNNATTVTDGRTIELARQIDTALFNLTGCRPHLIICNLRRTKVDCNRNIEEGACGNSEAEQAWTEFQNFIDTAQLLAQSQFSGKAFYIDLHGHGKTPHRLELGYGLSSGAYNNTDSILNTASFIANSSIQNLVNTNISGSTHAALLRGAHAFGTLLVDAGYPAVPSQQFPNTGGFPYFNGGYNTFNHTCLAQGNTVNGLQIECDSIVRSSYLHRKAFGDSLAAKLLEYLSFHQNIDLTNCNGCTPSLSANGITTLCPGQSVSLTATDVCDGCTVNWSNGMTGPSITVEAAGDYSATVFNPANPTSCVSSPASNAITVTAAAVPAAATVVAGGTTVLCPGQSVSLTATDICNGCTVNWSNGMTGPSITVEAAGDYSATVFNPANPLGCQTSPPSNAIAITTDQPPGVPTIAASGTTVLCPGQSVVLFVGNGCEGCTVNWSDGSNGDSITVFDAGVYTATLASPNCGTSPASLPVVVSLTSPPPMPVVLPAGPIALCLGQTITLTASGDCPDCEVHWSNGVVGASQTVGASAIYTAFFVDTCGTVGQASSQVEVVATAFAPTITVSSPCNLAAPSGGTNYQWYLDGMPIPGAVTPLLVAEATGLYAVSMTNGAGCSGTSDALFVEACTSAANEAWNRLDLEVIPNPASSKVYFQFVIGRPMQLHLELLTVNGQALKTGFNGIASVGEHSVEVDLKDIPPGIYLYRVRSEEAVGIGRLLVVK